MFWVDNWFDSKWLNFSGKMLGAIGVWDKNNVTVPPFSPNRIIGEGIFERQADATEERAVYKLRKDHKTIHPSQTGNENLNRKIKHLTTDAVFIWANENPDSTKFACVMVYIIKDNEVLTFYISLTNKPEKEKADNWSFHKIVGTKQDYVLQLLEKGNTYQLKFDID